MTPIKYLFLIFLAIPVIGIIDYAIFYGLAYCPNCNNNMSKWYTWIPASTLEILLFSFGILIGLKW